jgi:hypothetical protein
MTTTDRAERLAADGWTLTDTCKNPGDYKTASEWDVTIARKEYGFYTTTYTMGCGLRRDKKTKKPVKTRIYGTLTVDEELELRHHSEPTPPDLVDVMYSLVSDASCVRHGQSFEDFASEYGYDSDSIKALGIFNACTDVWRALVRMGADFDALDELFQDY